MEQIMNILEESMLFDKKVLLKNNCDITEIDDNIKNAIQKFGIIYSNKPIYSEIYNLLKELLVINNNIISKISQVKPNKINPLKNTLILFYVDWCPHCKTTKPIWEKLKQQVGDGVNGVKINFIEVDCDKDTDTASKFKVEGYPTIKMVRDNQVIEYDAKPDLDTLTQFLNTSL